MIDETQLSERAHNHLADWVAFVVYGSITVLAAIGGLILEAESVKALQAAAVLIVVAVAAWLAHSMWRVVRARARQDTEPEHSYELRSYELHELLRSWPIIASGLPGAIALLLAEAGAWSVASGLRIAQGLSVGVLFVSGLLTARLAGAGRSQQLIYIIALPGVGLLIVALEVAAHRI